MCNACNFHCCAYDGFGGCGCDSCGNPACWSDDGDEFFGVDDPLDDYDPGHDCRHAVARDGIVAAREAVR